MSQKSLKIKGIKAREGYFTRLVEAIKFNQTPPIAGGNSKKAVTILEKMVSDFPDSVDVKIHLSEAYLKTGKIEDAKKMLKSVLEKEPQNLFAKKNFSSYKRKREILIQYF